MEGEGMVVSLMEAMELTGNYTIARKLIPVASGHTSMQVTACSPMGGLHWAGKGGNRPWPSLARLHGFQAVKPAVHVHV